MARSRGPIQVSRYCDLGLRLRPGWKMRGATVRQYIFRQLWNRSRERGCKYPAACLIFRASPRCRVIRVNFSIPRQTFIDLAWRAVSSARTFNMYLGVFEYAYDVSRGAKRNVHYLLRRPNCLFSFREGHFTFLFPFVSRKIRLKDGFERFEQFRRTKFLHVSTADQKLIFHRGRHTFRS